MAFKSLGHFINDGIVFFVPLIADIFANRGRATPFALTMMFVIFYGSASILSAYVRRLADVTGGAGSLIAVGTTLLSLSIFTYYVTLSYATGAPFLEFKNRESGRIRFRVLYQNEYVPTYTDRILEFHPTQLFHLPNS
ncbi:MAG: hypothetical protein ACLP5V_00670 [Candidatus Bathyarchaeia archaeon]